MKRRKRIVVSVITDLVTDQRVIRICNSLAEMGFDVHVLARKMKDSLPLDAYSFSVVRFRCYMNHGSLRYAEFMIQLFFRLLFIRTDYFLANDLDSLLPNYMVSGFRRKYLFYDTHEYFTGVPELRDSPFKQKIWKKLERWMLPHLKTIYTVNNSVKAQYEQEYGVRLQVIRNVPVTQNIAVALPPAHWENKIILLVQGAGLNRGRSCGEMIDALPLLDDRFHLVFIGGGTAWADLEKRRNLLHLEGRIDMFGKMPPANLKSYTRLAHLGVSLDSFDDLNYLFNLPNKVFDYIQAGVPVLATAIPEVKQVLDQYQCGITVTDTSPQMIAEVITNLFDHPETYDRLRANCRVAASILNWENEVDILRRIYRPFL